MGYWITVVDDEPFSLANAKNLLKEKGMRVSCLRSGVDLLKFMKDHNPDLILLDILMPEMDGFETYRALRQFEEEEGRAQIPVIFLTGEDSSETERRGLKAGASDFIHKPFDRDILIKRIKNTIVNSKRIETLTEEAKTDRLTGFLNKASGTEKVTELCRTQAGAILIMDLDSFKLVNDLYGHDMGDKVLVALAGIIRQNVRSEDVICRIGGDEFLGFFTDFSGKDAVASLTERLNEELLKEADRLMGADYGIPLGITIGAAFTTAEAADFQILFRYADSALYEAKRNNKHGYHIYDPERPAGGEGEDLDRELDRVVHVVSERGDAQGAMLLGQEAFSSNYRFVERLFTRYGGTVMRILFSLSSEETGVIFSEMVSEFGNVLKNCLRKSDMILQWQQNRYFVILPMLTEKNKDRVINRIMNAWSLTGYPDRIHIRYVTSVLRKDKYEPKE